MSRTKHRIGGFRIIAPIGAGGFATVYRALDESTGREVAIKVLAENHSLRSEMRRRFVDEVDLLSSLNSPSVAKIYEVGETEAGQPFMVLELADRGDLRRRLEEIRRNQQVLTRADLTMLAHHLHEALATLHEADIVHRDVSPNNILIKARRSNSREMGTTLLEPGERFLLADLGHAKDLEIASGFTAGGGTKGFAAPEQLDDITVVDHRADIFSATAIMEWAAHDGDYAEDLDRFFEQGLASEPDDRHESIDAWHDAFHEALGAHLELDDDPTSRRWFFVLLQVAALIVLAMFVALLVVNSSQSDGSVVDPTPDSTSVEADPTTGSTVESPSTTSASEVLTVTGETDGDDPDDG